MGVWSEIDVEGCPCGCSCAICDGLSCRYNAITVPRRMMGEDNESSGAKARKRACCGFGGWAKDVEPR